MQVLNNKINALLHEPLHLQEIGGYQYGDDVLDIEFGPGPIIWQGLHLLALLNLILLLEVLHQPLEDLDVAVHTDVYVVHARGLGQVLLEVLHVRHQQLLLASEVLVHLAVLVEHVNHYHLLCRQRVARAPAAPVLLETVMDTAPDATLRGHLIRDTARTTSHY